MTNEEAEALQEAIESVFRRLLLDVHTAIPATVEKYDFLNGTIDAKPTVSLVVNGESLDYPVIPSIPVMFQRTENFSIEFPIERGDGVLLIFSEKSIENWQVSGQNSNENDQRSHSLTDAVAIPGLFSGGKGKRSGVYSASKAAILFGESKIELEKAGRVLINGGSLEILP